MAHPLLPAYETLIEQRIRRGLDLAVQMHGDGAVSNRFVLGLGAARAAGFHPPAAPAPGPHFYPDPAALDPAGAHEIHRWLHLAGWPEHAVA